MVKPIASDLPHTLAIVGDHAARLRAAGVLRLTIGDVAIVLAPAVPDSPGEGGGKDEDDEFDLGNLDNFRQKDGSGGES